MEALVDKIICVDGPSASGKGSVARIVAHELGWHLLQSGNIYRHLAFLAQQAKLNLSDSNALAQLATEMAQKTNSDKTMDLESEQLGEMASKLSVYRDVRAALIPLQLAAYQPPGLVAEGRDMATVIFPNAGLKIYLSASIEVRAKRRIQQLILNNPNNRVKMATILDQLKERDQRDRMRSVAPLKQAKNAVIIDSTTKTLDEVKAQVIELASKKFNF